MGVTATDLWPDSITIVTQKAPETILKEQASALGRKTRNVIEGEVGTSHTNPDGSGIRQIVHWFSLVAPALQDFCCRIFMIKHDPRIFYPLTLGPGLAGGYFNMNEIGCDGEREISSEAELMEVLQKVFSSPSVVSLVV